MRSNFHDSHLPRIMVNMHLGPRRSDCLSAFDIMDADCTSFYRLRLIVNVRYYRHQKQIVQPNCKTQTSIERTDAHHSQQPQSNKASLTCPQEDLLHFNLCIYSTRLPQSNQLSSTNEHICNLPLLSSRLHLRRHRKLPDSSLRRHKKRIFIIVTSMSTFQYYNLHFK